MYSLNVLQYWSWTIFSTTVSSKRPGPLWKGRAGKNDCGKLPSAQEWAKIQGGCCHPDHSGGGVIMPVPHLTLKVEDVYMQYVSWGNMGKTQSWLLVQRAMTALTTGSS